RRPVHLDREPTRPRHALLFRRRLRDELFARHTADPGPPRAVRAGGMIGACYRTAKSSTGRSKPANARAPIGSNANADGGTRSAPSDATSTVRGAATATTRAARCTAGPK